MPLEAHTHAPSATAKTDREPETSKSLLDRLMGRPPSNMIAPDSYEIGMPNVPNGGNAPRTVLGLHRRERLSGSQFRPFAGPDYSLTVGVILRLNRLPSRWTMISASCPTLSPFIACM
jgi:hypothetical protein